ncbi:enoyl-CoA hydratase [Pendulispora albinea]|uniref:Enoyl-CoA hydratase n=1 Tax=Pendulispora albinea TaxID=2741071 RepID=A0ABZ2M7U7_9BACT
MNTHDMSHIVTEVADGVQRIEIRRPEKKNALTQAMYAGMAKALAEAERDRAVRVILIHGQPQIFTSGNDIADFLQHPEAATEDAPVFQFLRNLMYAKKPVLAAVTGAAIGIGTTLLLHCDYVIAGQGAEFAMPFVNLALCPEAGSSLLLPLLVGQKRASELLLFGDKFSAEEALSMGLINSVVADVDVGTHAMAKARTLAQKPRAALLATKSLLKAKLVPQIEKAMIEEAHEFGDRLASAESKEALTAFLEKRRPDYSRFQ